VVRVEEHRAAEPIAPLDVLGTRDRRRVASRVRAAAADVLVAIVVGGVSLLVTSDGASLLFLWIMSALLP
jgi:hypothetical protein